MILCGKELNVGDYVKVEYTKGHKSGAGHKGGTIKGEITKLWEEHKQGQVNNGW